MKYAITISIISLLLENLFNIYLLNLRYLMPLFTLMSLICIYPFLKHNKNIYLIYSFILGFTYDIFFTNFYILNSLLYLVCSFIIYYIFNKHNYNIKTVIINSLLTIFIYNILLYLIFNFFMYINYSLISFSQIIRYFIIGNILYSIILYYITLLLSNNIDKSNISFTRVKTNGKYKRNKKTYQE